MTVDSQKDAIAVAAEWRLLGLLFERPRPGWYEEIAALAAEVPAEDLRLAAAAAVSATEGAYLAILGPGGLVPPRAVAYRPFADPGQMLADLTGRAEAFGFRRGGREDPADHVATLASFVGYLLLKEAFARASGACEAGEITAATRQHIVDDMLAPLVVPFAARLRATTVDYLRQAADALARRVPAPAAGPVWQPDGDAEDPCFGCGAP